MKLKNKTKPKEISTLDPEIETLSEQGEITEVFCQNNAEE